MILKFRENHIGKLERMRKKDRVNQGIEDDDRDREIVSITCSICSSNPNVFISFKN